MTDLKDINFKEFKVCDVFEKVEQEPIKFKANDFPTKPNKDNCIPLLTAGVINQGLARYATPEQCSNTIKNVISVSANGANSGATFYQDINFAVLQDAYAIKLIGMDIPNKEVGLFLATAVSKLLHGNYNWSNKAGWNKIKNKCIYLPATPSGEPDFAVMEAIVAELEAERVAELEAYLTVTGLDDYELTEEDKEILSAKLNGGGTSPDSSSSDLLIRWGEFMLSELFDINASKSLDAGALTFKQTGINFVGRSGSNNGIQGKIDKQTFLPNEANTISVTVIGNYKYAKYQETPYYCSQNINVLVPNGWKINKERAQFFITYINKFLFFYQGQQSGYKLAKLRNLKIRLPITSSGTPDFEFMERYIAALEKTVIKDVVEYKDRVIEETKKVVGE